MTFFPDVPFTSNPLKRVQKIFIPKSVWQKSFSIHSSYTNLFHLCPTFPPLFYSSPRHVSKSLPVTTALDSGNNITERTLPNLLISIGDAYFIKRFAAATIFYYKWTKLFWYDGWTIFFFYYYNTLIFVMVSI